jgi:hypothetical protein
VRHLRPVRLAETAPDEVGRSPLARRVAQWHQFKASPRQI